MRFANFALAGLFVAFASSAHSQITVYTDLTSFQAAAGATTLETFESSPLFNTTGAFGPATYNGFSLSGDGLGNNIGVHNSGIQSSPPAPFDGQNFFSWADGGPGNFVAPLTITFAQPTTAFAFDYFNNDSTDRYQITFAPGGDTYTGPPFNFQSTGFFGIVSATPLTSATLSVESFGGFIVDEGFDNVRVGTVTAVPEPGSVALLVGMGLSGAGFLARRRKNARQAA